MLKKATLILLAILVISTGKAFAGPYPANGVTPDAANAWATFVVGSQNQGTATNILGPVDGSLAIGSPSGGWITVGFDRPITNGPGNDLAVWENGFEVSGSGGLVYAELGYVDVSTDGKNWVEFPSVYLDAQAAVPNIDPTNVYNLAGNYVASGPPETKEGTPFDLDDILNTPEVLTGLVDPEEINYVRLQDIIGAGEGGSNSDQATYFGYGSDHLIYDGVSYGGGADWDAVGVINTVPIPGAVWLLASGLVGVISIRRRLGS